MVHRPWRGSRERPLGLIAQRHPHTAGAITSDAADKAARFLQLCDAFGLPVVSLVDTPGMMVGPEAEATGLVRHASRCCRRRRAAVPLVAVILRRGYGLGAQAMVGGSLHEPLLTVAWPTRAPRADGARGRGPAGCARSSRRSRTRPSASSASASSRGRRGERARRSTRRRCSSSTT
jgi:acetyl-CoA carboxylase carboxyltransferase component